MSEKPRQVNEPAVPTPPAPIVVHVTEPAPKPARVYSNTKRVYVKDTITGQHLPDAVPETWLQEFPHLQEIPKPAVKEGNSNG
ncbi:hypothetical protein DFO58_2206 [Arthrobacter sp. AG1021]|uniref:hypothetical protein n=1 Tax=Arthrobacter sp. AG1021 TaxID=2183908 RepID=UPI000EB2A133|nr:hypothetical protein [Arthrobacter sp. AG1021]RKS19701.1 hypothetical protein DFO58_2206 [Arthrobacter sp. AG1021]